MIDFWNFVIAVIGALVLAYTYARLQNKRDGRIGFVAAFIIGIAFHSILLHEKARQKWFFPWDHDNKSVFQA